MARPHATPDVFRAIAHPARRDILLTLKKRGPMTVNAIAQPMAMPLPTVSKHIQVLRLAGLITPRRRGRELHYQLVRRSFKPISHYARSIERD